MINSKFGITIFGIKSLLNNNELAKKIYRLLDSIDQIEHSIDFGIEDFEVSYEALLMAELVNLEEKIEKMLHLKKKYNLTYLVHLSFIGIDLCHPDFGI